MKKIIISKKVEVSAQGTRSHGNCTPTLKIKGKNAKGESECWVIYDSMTEAGEANDLTETTISNHCAEEKWDKINPMDILTKDRPFYCKVEDIFHLVETLTPFIQQMYADHLAMEKIRQEEKRKAEEKRQEELRLEKERKEKAKALAELSKYEAELEAHNAKCKLIKAKIDEQYFKCIDMGAITI